MEYLTIFAAEGGTAKSGLFDALGLHGDSLIINAIAFLILVGVLAKWVYPVLIKSIDERRATIEAGLENAKQSQEALQEAEQRVEGLLADARKEADEIIARGHTEATSMVSEAEGKAKQRAEQIVEEAHNQLASEITKAREALKKDTLHLVALATEKVIDEKLDASKDAKLVEKALADNKGSRA